MTAVGIDVGGTWLKMIVLSDDGAAIHSGRRRLPRSGVADLVCDVALEVSERHPDASIGVGLAGLVDSGTGTLIWGPHLEGRSVPYGEMLQAVLGFRVPVDNDANFAALAEGARGAGRGRDPVLLVALGTGIGVGLFSRGSVYRGRGFAGESGHMQMTDGGEVCDCGQTGCWETLVSGTVLDRAAVDHVSRFPAGAVAHAAGSSDPTAEHLAVAALEGDAAAQDAYRAAGEWLGKGIISLALMVDPEIVVLGGAVAEAGDLLLQPARETVASGLPGAAHRPTVLMVPGRYGAMAGAVGAALAGQVVHNGADDW